MANNSLDDYEDLNKENVFRVGDPYEMLKPWVHNQLFFEIVTIHAITFIFGLVGNLTVIIAMAGDKRARSATNTFLVNLAVGDLLMLCVNGPLETYYHFVIHWDENAVVCRAAKMAELLSAVSSVLNLLAVTIERFIVIVFPMKSLILCTMANMRKAVLGVWLLAIVLSLPILLSTGTEQRTFFNNVTSITLTYCDYSLNYKSIVIYEFFIVFAIPGCVLTICYAFVIRELWASTRKMSLLTQRSFSRQGHQRRKYFSDAATNTEETDFLKPKGKCSGQAFKGLLGYRENCKVETTSPQRKEEANTARKQVIKMLVIVVLLFFLCWGPRLIMDVIQKYAEYDSLFGNTMYSMRITFNILTFLHACINPFIYCFMSKSFRARFAKCLKVCGFCSKSRFITVPPIVSQRSQSGSSFVKNTDLKHAKTARAANKKLVENESTHIICIDMGPSDCDREVATF